MKIVKRLSGMIIMVLLLVTCFMPAKAAETDHASDTTSMDSYVTSEIHGYLSANHLCADYLSRAIPVWDADDDTVRQYVYFVFDDEQTIGYMNVYDGTKYQSGFVSADISIKNGESVQLLYKDGELFILNNEGARHLAGEYTDCTDVAFSASRQCTVASAIKIPDKIQARVNPTIYQLSLPYVANSSVDGVGICWAACIASRVNYEQGKSLTAKQVYNKCDNATSGRPGGTPQGNGTWIKFGYSLYGINVTCVNSGKNLGQITSLLDKNTPISCAFSRSGGAHEVLLTGVYIDASTNVYTFRDPNEKGTVSIKVSDAALTDYSKVTYTNSSYTYSSWYRSIY